MDEAPKYSVKEQKLDMWYDFIYMKFKNKANLLHKI